MTAIDTVSLILLVGLAVRFATRRTWDKAELRGPDARDLRNLRWP